MYEFDEDEYEREVLQEQLDEQDRIEREQREREQQIPVNNNPQPVENIVNEENIIQNQPEIPQVNVNNNPQPVENIVNEENIIQKTDDLSGYRRTDVGTENDSDRFMKSDESGSYESGGKNDGCCGRLDQSGNSKS